MHGLLVRLRPSGPWRIGSDAGSRSETADLYHSDSLYSAVTHAMKALGELDAWLEATARAAAEPAVRFTSCFPWQADHLFVVPPRTVWPPVSSALPRLRGARFLPLPVVAALLDGRSPDEESWTVAPHNRCLVPAGSDAAVDGPFRIGLRGRAPVDRVVGASGDARYTACLEFAPGAGLWFAISFAGEQARDRWSGPCRAAIRLLADSGFGGRRSAGWGRSHTPEFADGELPDLLLPPPAAPEAEAAPVEAPSADAPPTPDTGYWLLSVFRPGSWDTVDWDRGHYTLLTRGGRIENPERWGEEKKQLRMVGEGSVLMAGSPPVGSSADVSPDGFPHPVFRYGCPVSLPIPVRAAL